MHSGSASQGSPGRQGVPVDDIDDHFITHFQPMPRPAVSAGFDIVAHIAPAIKAKIWKDEYVDLHTLRPATTYQ